MAGQRLSDAARQPRGIVAVLLLIGSALACQGAAPETRVSPAGRSTPTATAPSTRTATATNDSTPAPVTPAATPAPPSPIATPRRMSSPEYGMQAFLWWRPETGWRDLDLVRAAGFGWVKQIFAWRDIEGSRKGAFDWSRTDRIVEDARVRGLELLVRVDHQPAWAGGGYPVSGPPEDLEDFADFLAAMAGRYRGQIRAYQIWNEPNLSREWGGRPPNAAGYVSLLCTGYRAVKAADPGALVVSAGLTPTTQHNAEATPDVLFLREMYANGAAPCFDVLGAHAAGYKAPPGTSPDEAAANPLYNHGEGAAGRIYTFRHVEDLRQVMVEQGDAGKQVAVLEFGWTSDPVHPAYAWHAVTESEKADYLVRAFAYARDHWQPWIGVMFVIYLADPDWTPADEQYWWAITDPDGTPRQAYLRLKAMPK